MNPRLPAINRFAATLRGTAVTKTTSVADSLGYLVAHRAELVAYDSPEALGIAVNEAGATKGERALVFHMDAVRNSLAREFWTRHLYIGPSVLGDLLFHFTRDAAVADPLLATLELLRDRRAARPGLLVMALHSFGIQGAGIMHTWTKQRLSVVNVPWGYAVLAQTNNMRGTLKALDAAGNALGVRKRIPHELIRHWRCSRGAEWLERNPLIVIRAVNLSGSYYENQPMLMGRVRAATSLLAMLSAFQPRTSTRAGVLFSSSRINNRETLDIDHYLALSDNPAIPRELDGDCVPMNLDRNEVLELSDLAVELDPSYRGRRTGLFARLEKAVENVHDDYLQHSLRRTSNSLQGRMSRKLFESMQHFRRSWGRSASDWVVTLNLATALEMLLIDGQETGAVKDLMRRRTQRLLRGTRGTTALQDAVWDLYERRNGMVHAGRSDHDADIYLARQAYVRFVHRDR
jgi:hypothetical protein